ncbi:MAG: large conductance mechanosensitive channel protein MscL [Ktedonobacteraceae bacterium]
MKLLNDFKAFILRGNVVDLAIGIIIGVAFGAVVTALVADIITPLIGIFGKVNFPDLSFTINGSRFLIGQFINAVISFLILAFVVFFFVVRPVNALMTRSKVTEEAKEPAITTTRDCPYCKSSIALDATRCPYCTSEVSQASIA